MNVLRSSGADSRGLSSTGVKRIAAQVRSDDFDTKKEFCQFASFLRDYVDGRIHEGNCKPDHAAAAANEKR